MHCSNCGNEVFKNEKFCPKCGMKIQQEESTEQKAPSKAKNSNTVIYLCIVIIVLAVGMVVTFISKSTAANKPGIGENKVISEQTASETQKPSVTVTTTKESTTAKPKETQPQTTKKPETQTTTAKSAKPTDSKGIVEPDYHTLGNIYYIEPEGGLYLRKGPGQEYDKIALLEMGSGVQIQGERDDSPGWTFVRIPSGSLYGWVSSEYITPTNPDKSLIDKFIAYEKSFETVVTAEEGLNVRTTASANSTKLGTIPYGRTITVHGYSAYDFVWLYISVNLDGRTVSGFVDGRYVQH